MDIKDRIKKIIKNSGLKQSEFARKLGIQPNHLSMLVSTDTNLSANILFKFAEIGVNMNWLMLGEGEVLWRKDLENSANLSAELDKLKLQLIVKDGIIDELKSIFSSKNK